MKFWVLLLNLTTLLLSEVTINAQTVDKSVKVSGAMKNVMQKGELYGEIFLDTIQTKQHLYGLGPKEYLKGELLIIDGRSYVSGVHGDGSVKMEETFEVAAPFFVYTNVEKWEAYSVPQNIRTMKQLENYIDQLSKNHNRPFAFKLQRVFSNVDFHIQNLPEGTVVRSPKDAHQGQGKYERKNTEGDMIGFFSTEHQSIFTHHDTFIHLHFINSERTEMGHVDDLLLNGEHAITLYLPAE